jgi:hypothetical protein
VADDFIRSTTFKDALQVIVLETGMLWAHHRLKLLHITFAGCSMRSAPSLTGFNFLLSTIIAFGEMKNPCLTRVDLWLIRHTSKTI